MNLGERLLMARKSKRLTQKDLAVKAGLSQVTISDIERGRNSTTTEAPSLAKALGITVDYLLTGKEDNTELEVIATDEDFAFIPFYDVKGSCGSGYNNGDHVVVKGELAFKRTWLRESSLKEKDLAIITAKGESMWPTISEGAILLINSAYNRVESGKVYALLHNDEVRVKRLFDEFTGAWRIASDNPNKSLYPDIILSTEAVLGLQIIGRVVWTGGLL